MEVKLPALLGNYDRQTKRPTYHLTEGPTNKEKEEGALL